MKKHIEKYLLFIVFIASSAVFTIMYLNLSSTVETLAHSLLNDKIKQTRAELDNFFIPVIEDIQVAQKKGERAVYDSITLDDFNQRFIPLVQESAPISSMMLADELGNEFMLLHLDSVIINRVTYNGSESVKSDRYEWELDKRSVSLNKSWKEEKDYDPRVRPWFEAAINDNLERPHWTSPYTFFTTKDPGITVSQRWTDTTGVRHVIAFDLMLLDISDFTTHFEITPNGKVFILTEDTRVLGLPSADKYNDPNALKTDVLKDINTLNNSYLTEAHKAWKETELKDQQFQFTHDGEAWWCRMETYSLGDQSFLIGMVAPEKDFLAQVQHTRWLIIFGFILVILFTLIISKAYKQKHKLNEQLHFQNLLVNEKNKEILDSINYAKRIQKAILPSDSTVKKLLPDSFILYKPKDIVAGDFYWMETSTSSVSNQNIILFAAADCTGHGVPGAMVSVVCNNALNRSVKEYGLTDPGEILNKSREIVVAEFEKSDEEVKDGMDIALCSLELVVPDSMVLSSSGSENVSSEEIEELRTPNSESGTVEPQTTAKLQYAGAHNPLWIIRKQSSSNLPNDIPESASVINMYDFLFIEIKANKQPIGKFDHPVPYTTHTLTLQKGDIVYIFSDGYADQFGGDRGKKFKAKSFRELLIEINAQPMEQQKILIENAFENWKGDLEQIDDVCIIGVRV